MAQVQSASAQRKQPPRLPPPPLLPPKPAREPSRAMTSADPLWAGPHRSNTYPRCTANEGLTRLSC